MADYYGVARSNYFKVKDVEALKKICEDFQLDILSRETPSGTFYGFGSYDFNSIIVEDKPGGGEVERDVYDEVSSILEDDQVLIVMESGHEKLNYVSGYAHAVNAKGETVTLNLQDIYDKVKEANLGTFTECMY